MSGPTPRQTSFKHSVGIPQLPIRTHDCGFGSVQIGNINARQRNWTKAPDSFKKSLGLNAEDAHAHFNAALAANRLSDFEAAADHALNAITIMYFFPQAHFQMGLAFEGLGDLPRAQRSWELAVLQAPRFLEAHGKLAELHQAQKNIPLWVKHKQLAQGAGFAD